MRDGLEKRAETFTPVDAVTVDVVLGVYFLRYRREHGFGLARDWSIRRARAAVSNAIKSLGEQECLAIARHVSNPWSRYNGPCAPEELFGPWLERAEAGAKEVLDMLERRQAAALNSSSTTKREQVHLAFPPPRRGGVWNT